MYQNLFATTIHEQISISNINTWRRQLHFPSNKINIYNYVSINGRSLHRISRSFIFCKYLELFIMNIQLKLKLSLTLKKQGLKGWLKRRTGTFQQKGNTFLIPLTHRTFHILPTSSTFLIHPTCSTLIIPPTCSIFLTLSNM